jgi:hypothetical protein
MRKIKNQAKTTKTAQADRITFALNANLCQQAENWLNSQRVQNNFDYPSLSFLIRKSLEAYQVGEININLVKRDKHAVKREITIRFSSSGELLNFYYSLPYTQRTAIIEESLRGYLEKLSGENV